MFRERSEIEGLRGERGDEVVVVEGPGLATTEGILVTKHLDYECLLQSTTTMVSCYRSSMTMLRLEWLSADDRVS
jgi:hypothetical protein